METKTGDKTMKQYTRQHQSAERVAMRHWLRAHNIKPVMGQEPSHTERLMKQVIEAGGNPYQLMLIGQQTIDKYTQQAWRKANL